MRLKGHYQDFTAVEEIRKTQAIPPIKFRRRLLTMAGIN